MVLSSAIALGIVIGSMLLFNAAISIAAFTGKWRTIFQANDSYISARNLFGPLKLGTSLFSSTLGSWIIFAVPELSFLYGLLPLFLYALAVILPIFYLRYIAAYIRDISGDEATSLGDFVLKRYGIPMHIVFLAVSSLAMFLSLAGELLFVGFAVQSISPSIPRNIAIIILAALTWSYTAIGGLAASIISDFYQAVVVIIILIVGLIAASTTVNISSRALREASTFSTEGLISGAIMLISFFPAYLIDQGAWQRVWAGRDIKSVQSGLLIASAFIAPVMIFFGFGGILAKSASGTAEITDASSAFFSLIISLNTFLVACMLVLMVTLVASSLDSSLNAISAIFWGVLKKFKVSFYWIIPINAITIILAVLSAIYWESNVLILFLIGNLFAAAIMPPILYGLTKKSTQFGAMCGFILGVLSIGIFGFIRTSSLIGALQAYTVSTGLASIYTLLTFLIVTAVSFLSTVIVSFIHKKLAPLERIPSNNRSFYKP
ncbi:transporter, solute:sodium symporter (SSS) family protein [Cardiosporidium cionae]|uniref:Transporter, solute:sodium symporter (SSS) family protein n=1 Tax=Cardiosporidium cionae TaxID=476202 RepID=A0ABQ7JD49_9APIC|nr:transporter, solute:sodium symporter (SSS) family protein [Cardiosporidium cionae]|eukprot:KAF8821923.1 transporter, solute:sodium symporter (SSS) family protein [Cardiosporidium cionae]